MWFYIFEIIPLINLLGIISRKIRNMYIYNLLEQTVNLLEKNNIDYILDWGSLLGAYRNNKVLYNDDDCDISIMDSNIDIIEKILHDNLKNFIVIRHNNNLFIIPNTNIHLDIYFMKYDNDNDNYINLYRTIPKNVLKHKSTIVFGNREYKCPYDIEKYLIILYKYIGEISRETNNYDYEYDIEYKNKSIINKYCQLILKDIYFITMIMPINKKYREFLDYKLKFFVNIIYGCIRRKES